jgi:hypothetical protein
MYVVPSSILSAESNSSLGKNCVFFSKLLASRFIQKLRHLAIRKRFLGKEQLIWQKRVQKNQFDIPKFLTRFILINSTAMQ